MNKIHKIFCIMGRTASGKSELTKRVAENLGLKVLKSYTTRDYRKGEDAEISDHIHIAANEIGSYRNSMVAYTERVGYCSFATKEQLVDCDFYIINPSGYYELLAKTVDLNIDFITIFITTPYLVNIKRAQKRGDFANWKTNYNNENQEFKEFEREDYIRYRVLNDGSIEDGVKKLQRIVKRELED